jgi:anthranilate synthase component 2
VILLIDNYDSFTYNLYQYLCELGAEVTVRRNDAITTAEIAALAPERIVISPGPCTPHEAGISVDVIREFAGRTPILGVCLGHQAIGAAFGGAVVRAPVVMHGKLSAIRHDGRGIFADVPQGFAATRYHSLIVERETLPDCLEITAETSDGIIMGLRHRDYPVEGVQFHPEAILTEHGREMLKNFLGRQSAERERDGYRRSARAADVGDNALTTADCRPPTADCRLIRRRP